jgi:DNA-binding Lrp family transcriptional regulator
VSGSPQLTADPEAQRLLAELDTACTALVSGEAAVDEASRRRNHLFMVLRDMGVTQREIADRAKISEPAVAKAIKKAREEAATTA